MDFSGTGGGGGVQRFRYTLKTPYELELKTEPGKADLKHIVIDGSNVAITHGLKKVFSCRGIALQLNIFGSLATETSLCLSHSGEQGVILMSQPLLNTYQLRPHTEQHFLTQLQELGILSLTPAQMVFGERIASHDDRDMQPLLNALPDVGTFDPGFWSPNTQVANTSHQPPSRNQGASSGSWLPQHPHFTPLATVPSTQQNLLGPAQRSSSETSQLRAALLKIFPDSEQKLKIDQILAAHPDMKDLNALSALVLD
ncbi:NEDD4-binding protein 1 [Lemmus lemmus]